MQTNITPSSILHDLDFTLYKGKTQTKGFTFRNDDDTYYNLTGTVRLDLYTNGPTNSPETIQGTITEGTSNASFLFPSTLLTEEGNFEYIVVETKPSSEQIVLIRGNIIVSPYVTFSETVESFLLTELPINFTLDNNFVNQQTKYWRLFLQEGFDITDANLNKDSAWPILVNALIAKLIAYNALTMALKGNLITVFGSSTISTSTSKRDVKSIETGPTKVEFHPAGDTMNQIIKSSTSANSDIFKNLSEDLCGLARKLTVKVPMCRADKVVTIFQYVKSSTANHNLLINNVDPTPSRL